MSTVCTSCTHCFIKDNQSTTGKLIWYNMLCRAHPRAETTDPITGETGFAGTNDIGTSYVTEDPFDYCRNHNTGACPDFAPSA